MSIVTKESNPELYNALFPENNDIKEILDNLIRYRSEDNKWQPEDILTIEDVWQLLDYITNLQEENFNYRRLGFKHLCDKNKELEEENERLNKELDYANNDNIYYIAKIDKAIEKLESIRIFGLRCGKTLFSTLINETIDILQGSDKE